MWQVVLNPTSWFKKIRLLEWMDFSSPVSISHNYFFHVWKEGKYRRWDAIQCFTRTMDIWNPSSHSFFKILSIFCKHLTTLEWPTKAHKSHQFQNLALYHSMVCLPNQIHLSWTSQTNSSHQSSFTLVVNDLKMNNIQCYNYLSPFDFPTTHDKWTLNKEYI